MYRRQGERNAIARRKALLRDWKWDDRTIARNSGRKMAHLRGRTFDRYYKRESMVDVLRREDSDWTDEPMNTFVRRNRLMTFVMFYQWLDEIGESHRRTA